MKYSNDFCKNAKPRPYGKYTNRMKLKLEDLQLGSSQIVFSNGLSYKYISLRLLGEVCTFRIITKPMQLIAALLINPIKINLLKGKITI